MIFEPYLGCYGSIFSPNLVCRSWDYGLSAKWSPIFNRMSGTRSNVRFILWKHITLICQHDKLPLVRWYATYGISPIVCTKILLLLFLLFCMNFGTVISQKQNQQSCWNFHSIFVIIRNRSNHLFSVWSLNHDVIQAPFCVIIHIFITIHHKLTNSIHINFRS